MTSIEDTVYVVWVRRETWDTPMELCRVLFPDALAQVIRALLAPGVHTIIEIRIEVRREVG